jgi:hypothetical protein
MPRSNGSRTWFGELSGWHTLRSRFGNFVDLSDTPYPTVARHHIQTLTLIVISPPFPDQANRNKMDDTARSGCARFGGCIFAYTPFPQRIRGPWVDYIRDSSIHSAPVGVCSWACRRLTYLCIHCLEVRGINKSDLLQLFYLVSWWCSLGTIVYVLALLVYIFQLRHCK